MEGMDILYERVNAPSRQKIMDQWIRLYHYNFGRALMYWYFFEAITFVNINRNKFHKSENRYN